MTQPNTAAEATAALAAAQAAGSLNVRQRLLEILRRLFGMGQWRAQDAERFAGQAVPLVFAAQHHIAHTTTVSLAREVTHGGGHVDIAKLAEQPPVGYPRKADPAEVYQRPFHAVWSSLAEGHDLLTAVEHGQTRLEQIAATDVQLAKTHAAQRVMTESRGIVGYERVLNLPSCGLCIVASTQRYHKDQLMPLHPGCDCGEKPIYGTEETGQVIHEDRLVAAHDAIEHRFGVSDSGARSPDYRKVLLDRLDVTDHPEMGPVFKVLPTHVNK